MLLGTKRPFKHPRFVNVWAQFKQILVIFNHLFPLTPYYIQIYLKTYKLQPIDQYSIAAEQAHQIQNMDHF